MFVRHLPEAKSITNLWTVSTRWLAAFLCSAVVIINVECWACDIPTPYNPSFHCIFSHVLLFGRKVWKYKCRLVCMIIDNWKVFVWIENSITGPSITLITRLWRSIGCHFSRLQYSVSLCLCLVASISACSYSRKELGENRLVLFLLTCLHLSIQTGENMQQTVVPCLEDRENLIQTSHTRLITWYVAQCDLACHLTIALQDVEEMTQPSVLCFAPSTTPRLTWPGSGWNRHCVLMHYCHPSRACAALHIITKTESTG